MTRKIKVSKRVAVFIEKAKEFYLVHPDGKEYMIEEHSEAIFTDWSGVKGEALIMKQYSTEQLKDILYNGYEIE